LGFRELGGNGVSPLRIQIRDVRFVKVLQFFRGRIWAGDIEVTILQEIVIGVSATGFTPADELLVALGYQ
jgi:hypothetical protein